MQTILFQGDSITDCGRDNCGGAGYPLEYNMGPGYPGLVSSFLQGEYPEKDFRVFNRGIFGNRIVDLYARWKIDALNLHPDIISIFIGINDVGHEIYWQNGVEAERFDKIYRSMLDWTLEVLPGVKLLIMEPFILPFDEEDSLWLNEVARRLQIIRKIADDYNAAFVPVQKIFNEALQRAPHSYWMADRLHPCAAGQQLLAKGWLEAAKPLLGI